MSSSTQEWDSVTKIGKSVHSGGSQRETVVKGKSAINAAQRSGAIVSTEKKYAAGNSVRLLTIVMLIPYLDNPSREKKKKGKGWERKKRKCISDIPTTANF
jgi:hypothetical protein